jgi:hypothetical protein
MIPAVPAAWCEQAIRDILRLRLDDMNASRRRSVARAADAAEATLSLPGLSHGTTSRTPRPKYASLTRHSQCSWPGRGARVCRTATGETGSSVSAPGSRRCGYPPPAPPPLLQAAAQMRRRSAAVDAGRADL